MYTHSLYWALATTSSLGYGAGPVAVSEPELLFAILCQITGACLYAAIFGNIAHLISKADATGARYQVRRGRVGARAVQMGTYLPTHRPTASHPRAPTPTHPHTHTPTQPHIHTPPHSQTLHAPTVTR